MADGQWLMAKGADGATPLADSGIKQYIGAALLYASGTTKVTGFLRKRDAPSVPHSPQQYQTLEGNR